MIVIGKIMKVIGGGENFVRNMKDMMECVVVSRKVNLIII